MVLRARLGCRKTFADLTPATGARTTRFCRTLQRRSSSRRAPLTIISPCDAPCASTLKRPPHPALHVRDDRDTPLFGRGGTRELRHISEKQKSEIFFARGLDSRISIESPREIQFCAHAIFQASRPWQAGLQRKTQPIRPSRLGKNGRHFPGFRVRFVA
jgi:hypothetical protein